MTLDETTLDDDGLTPGQRSIEVYELTDEDIRRGVHDILGRLGMTLDELRKEARRGRFSSEDARIGWFLIKSVLPRYEAA
jgi:hypothetical protein